MQWFQSDEDISFDVDLLVNGLPITPDADTTFYTIRDQTGTIMAGLDHVAVTVPGTSARMSVSAASNHITDDAQTRYVLLSFEYQGRSYHQAQSYGLRPFLPLQATTDDVRAALGLSYEELPDTDIDLYSGYYDYLGLYKTDYANAFMGTTVQRTNANRTVVMAAAIRCIPSLQLRAYQTRENENAIYGRFRTIDWAALLSNLEDSLGAALGGLGVLTGINETPIPVLFGVSLPVDPVTNV